MPSPQFVPYKNGVQVLNATPTGLGGLGINNNFIAIGDQLESLVSAIATANAAIASANALISNLTSTKANVASLTGHTTNTGNPHSTTAAQVGAYTSAQTDNLLNGKLSLAGGTLSGSLSGTWATFSGSLSTDTTSAIGSELSVNASTVTFGGTDLQGAYSLAVTELHATSLYSGTADPIDVYSPIYLNGGDLTLDGGNLNLNNGSIDNASTIDAAYISRVGGGYLGIGACQITIGGMSGEGSAAIPAYSDIDMGGNDIANVVNLSVEAINSNGITVDGAVIATEIVATTATIGDVSNTELQYLNGVTSAIQTQLNAKAATSALASYLPLAGGTMASEATISLNSGYIEGCEEITSNNLYCNALTSSEYKTGSGFTVIDSGGQVYYPFSTQALIDGGGSMYASNGTLICNGSGEFATITFGYLNRIKYDSATAKYNTNAAAVAGGLAVGTFYITTTGEVRCVV